VTLVDLGIDRFTLGIVIVGIHQLKACRSHSVTLVTMHDEGKGNTLSGSNTVAYSPMEIEPWLQRPVMWEAFIDHRMMVTDIIMSSCSIL
jgi:hypothetical protein